MLRYYLLLGISIILNSISLILMKKGALQGINFATCNKLVSFLHFFTNNYILLSIIVFGFGAVAWLLALTKIDLSLAYPTISISYIIIAIASYYLFGEVISIYRLVGIGIIIFGVIIMFQK